MQNTFKHNIEVIQNAESLVGVLFQFDTVSLNGTKVKKDAKIYATSDAIVREHLYPLAEGFNEGIAGRIKRFYVDKELNALLCDFELYNEVEKEMLLRGEIAFSVAWLSDDYANEADGALAFNSLTIYETSLVGTPAFNTCAAQNKENLTCVSQNSACGCGGKHSACGCGGKNSAENRYILTSMSEQEILAAIAALEEKLRALEAKLDAIEQKVAAMDAPAAAPEETAVEEAVNSLHSKISEHDQVIKAIEAHFDEVLKSVSDFVEKATKSLQSYGK